MSDCPPEMEPRGLGHQSLTVDYLRNISGYPNNFGPVRLVPIEVPPPAPNVISLAEKRAKKTREKTSQRPPGW